MTSKKKNIPADVDYRKRATSVKSRKIAETEVSRHTFPRSNKVKKPDPENSREFKMRAKIARMAENMSHVQGRVSVMSVKLENGGQPDSEGKIRARVSIGRGTTYVSVTEESLSKMKIPK